jgi:diguanylate cyclase (GGDEF)-like protein
MLDLDHFKKVNDTLGHPRGDAVLVELAARLRAEVREVDTVARYGGEELVVILPETDEAGAAQAAERICDAVRRTPFGGPGEAPVAVTVSVGAAVIPAHGADAEDLLRRADEALYEAKRTGRDTWRVAAPSGAATAEVPTAD